MPRPPQQSIEVAQSADVSAARQTAKAMAREMGFDEKVKEEIAIAVSELGWNLAKYARRGRLTLRPLQEAGRVGIQIESVDSGPGIPEVERAMADGFSTAGSLGCGLGAVNRLMDEFHVRSRRGAKRGTRIVCRRWRSLGALSMVPCPLDFGVATRPHPMRTVNGDAFIIERWGETALVGVIDGLGHGPLAHQAAETARHYIENHFNQPLKAIFRGVGRACRATNGVVMALGRFDWARKTLAFASVGNVEARVLGSPQPMNFVVRRGVIGLNAPDPVVTEHGWGLASVLVLHSDGVMTRWRWEDYVHLDEGPATVFAQQLLQRLARDDDDATVVVVKAAPGGGYKADGKSGGRAEFPVDPPPSRRGRGR